MKLEKRQWGQTIEIRPAGAEHWRLVAVVNPRADSSKGIPAREDREFAQLIVNAVGSHADLLAALDALFEHCAMVHKYWGECSNVREADAAIAAARAALTKARGQA